jgi:lysophospholipase L1-like esterase
MSVLELKQGARVLFQGDSVTDCGRREERDGLGNGYVRMVSGRLLARFASKELTIVNRGISGNKVADLQKRWKADCLDVKPDVLSILIGINDTWKRFSRNELVSAQQYYEHYNDILLQTREALPSCVLVLCEPFVLPTPPDRLTWREDLDAKLEVVHRLAHDYQAIVVPFDTIFTKALAQQLPQYWAGDGVHPSVAGHGLMADAWWQCVVGS